MPEFNDMNDVPVVPLPNSEDWGHAYEWGDKLNERFPNQGASDFSYACQYNGFGPCDTHKIKSLIMAEEGYNDGPDWVWVVVVEADTALVYGYGTTSVWIARGGCDYTGWDCQSSLSWTQVL